MSSLNEAVANLNPIGVIFRLFLPASGGAHRVDDNDYFYISFFPLLLNLIGTRLPAQRS